MKKREFIAWILMPIDKKLKLKQVDEYASIALTKNNLKKAGAIPAGVEPTKVRVIEI